MLGSVSSDLEMLEATSFTEDDLIKLLADDDNQDMLLTLEGKLKTKKLASVWYL